MCCGIVALLSAANFLHAAPPESIVRGTVADISDRRPVLLVDFPQTDTVHVDDRAVIVRGVDPVAVGRVHYVEPNRAGIRLTHVTGELQPGLSAIIIAATIDASVCAATAGRVPPYVTIDAVMPATPLGWSNAGTADGLFVGQTGLVIRNGYATHVARVQLADAKTALLEFAPIIPVGPVRRGDRLQLDRDRSSDPEAPPSTAVATVIGVEPGAEAETIALTAPAGTTYQLDDRLDVLRNGAPVSFAVVVEIDGQFVTARTEPSLSRDGCQIGDMARRRPPADATDADRRGWAFLVDRDYALISLGSGDGVSRGDQLHAASTQGRPIALRVQSVYPDHCGAAIERNAADAEQTLAPWSDVFTQPDRVVLGATVGLVERHGPVDWLATAKLNDAVSPPSSGAVLTCDGSPPAAVVVLAATPTALLCYAPKAWRIGVLDGRSIRADARTAAAPEVTTVHRTADVP